ncbi:MAG: precorrin-6A reductase [Clostridia bacterium]|nr:precorrin-6A reductase [Clostridia bacterium]
MYNICIFAGTTEGRRLIERLCGRDVLITASVATEYAKTLIAPIKGLTVLTGRMDSGEMEALFKASRFDTVIDATHPYADRATENIKRAALSAGVEYIRVKRDESDAPDGTMYFESARDAAAYLDGRDGNILFTTGVKDIPVFSGIKDFSERAFVRVLPAESSVRACIEAGVKPARIIAMQGPFSRKMNAATLAMANAAYLVTKDGGSAGGFYEKLEAAKDKGARLVVIGRPKDGEGLTLSEAVSLISSRTGVKSRPHVSIVGMGMGSRKTLTGEAVRALSDAECIVGAKRLIRAAAFAGKPCHEAVSADDIAAFIARHGEYSRFAAVMSGDAGFYSGAKKLVSKLSFCDVKVTAGISSISYLCAALGTSYDDAVTVSLHGRSADVVKKVRENRRTFVLLGGENTAQAVCERLSRAGLGYVRVSIGERLGYDDERLTKGTAEELKNGAYDPLCAALIENDRAGKRVSYGLPDLAFLRGDADGKIVPMTKSEVRAVCLSKLELSSDSVLWDIGAGTGSVSVEAARIMEDGHVYAIEKREDAAFLIEKNSERFGTKNLTVIRGEAPKACEGLPVPTHAFIGGSEGRLSGIFDMLLKKNPRVRIVSTAVSLETAAQMGEIMKKYGFTTAETVLISAARGKRAGEHTLMRSENPIYIFTMQTEEAL